MPDPQPMPRGAVAEPEIGPDTARVPEPPRSAKGLLAVIAVLVGAGLAFAMLAVAAHRVPYFAADLAITRAIQSVSLQWLDVPLRTLNAMGFPPVVGIVYGLLIASIFVAGARWEALSSGFAVLGGVALNHASKLLVARPRPSIELIAVEHQHIANSSFPAGHVLNFTALAGFLCCLVALRMAPSWQRTTLVSSLIALIVLMGVARIDSGEHWPSDVLGGYLLGVSWVAVTLEFYRWGRRRFAGVRWLLPHRAFALSSLSVLAAIAIGCAHARAAAPDPSAAAMLVEQHSEGPVATSDVPGNPLVSMRCAVVLPDRTSNGGG